jgi:hypothetical protein
LPRVPPAAAGTPPASRGDPDRAFPPAPWQARGDASAWGDAFVRRAGSAIAFLLAIGAAAPATAQEVVGTVGLATADRYRGTAPFYDGPLLRIGASIDTSIGAYASGAAAWQFQGTHWGRSQLLLGLSRPIVDDWAWDLAAASTFFGDDREYDYTEAMLGVIHRDVSVRAWWTRHYYGQEQGSLYLEANGSVPLSSRWRVVAHVGRLSYIAASYGGTRWPPRVDGLAGLAWSVGAFDARVTIDGLLSGSAPFAHADGLAGHGIQASASWAF